MTDDKTKLRAALVEAKAAFLLQPDSLWRHPRERRKLVIASPSDQLEVNLNKEPSDKQIGRAQAHYESTGDLVNIRNKNDAP